MGNKLLWNMLKIEFRSILQRRVWMLMPILYGSSLIVRIVSDRQAGMTNLHGSMNPFHNLEFTFSLALMILLGISVIRRDVVKPSYAWKNTLPLDRSWSWIAKWVAGMWYSFTYIGLILVIYAGAGLTFHVPIPQLVWNSIEYFMIYSFSYGLSIILGMTLGTWIRNRTIYIAGLGLWFFGTYMIDLILVGSMNLYSFRIMRLSPYYMNSIWEHELYGRIWGRQELLYYALFAIVLMLVCSILSIYKLQLQEPGKRPEAWKRSSVMGCILLVASAFPSTQMWNERIGTEYDDQSVVSAGVMMPQDVSITTTNTKIVLSRQTDERLHFDVSVSLELSEQDISLLSASPTGAIEFKLDKPFEMEQVYVNGNRTEFIRSADAVYVLQPKTGWSTSHVMKFIYSMSGVDRQYHGGVERITHAVVNEATWLNANLHWIPVITAEANVEGLRDDHTTLADSMVHLELVGFRDEVYTSIKPVHISSSIKRPTAYEGVYGNGIAVWSGKFETVEVNGSDIRVLTTPSALEEAKQYASSLSEAIDYYQTWVELPNRLNYILYMPMDHIAAMDTVNQNVGNTLMFREYERNNLDEMRLFSAISYILFNDMDRKHSLSHNEPPSVIVEIRNLMLTLVNKKLHQSAWAVVDPSDEINIRFEQAYHAGKEEQIKQVLYTWYEQYGQAYIDMRAYISSSEAPTTENWYPIISREEWLQTWDAAFGEFQS